MQDHDPTRRTALKVLGLLGAGAAGSTGVAAARDVETPMDVQDEGGNPAHAGIYVALLRPQADVDAPVHGLAIVQERDEELKFVVNVMNLRNAFMGHIHEDEALGPIAVWLYEFETQDERLEEGQFSGILDVGTITDDVIEEGRASEAESETVEGLLEKIDAGEAYVNIHTEEHPSGVIAGQLVPFDPRAVMNAAGGFVPGSY